MEQTFEEYLASSASAISSYQFLTNILLAALLSLVVGWVYTKYGNSLSNRKQFSKNFVLISMTTMLVITIVKSSLALSLGLVGALSIVRFRAAIKEPEELGFLFLAIAIGLGLGANQVAITTIAIMLILAIMISIRLMSNEIYNDQNLHLVINCPEINTLNIEDIIFILKKYCTSIDLKRLDESANSIEASFLIEIEGIEQISILKNELKDLEANINITFLDNKGLI